VVPPPPPLVIAARCDDGVAQMEMKNKFINHARNIWDRAVTLLPRVDQFW
jgi:hypothetical protein